MGSGLRRNDGIYNGPPEILRFGNDRRPCKPKAGSHVLHGNTQSGGLTHVL
jgi:hypothetical protein